jgi:hypothetical protein
MSDVVAERGHQTRLDVLDASVRLNSQDIRDHSSAIKRLELSLDSFEEKLASHETRLGTLEPASE